MIRRMGTAALLASAPVLSRAAQAPGPCSNPAITACTPQLVAMATRLSATFDSLAGVPTPPDASAADRPEAVRFGTWLREASDRVAAQAALGRKKGRPPKPGVPRTNYFLQMVALRNQLLAAADKFDFTSTTLKARHEIALNAIRNLK